MERDAPAAERSRPFRWAVRAGFVTRSVTYGVVGAIALALAVGAGAAPAAPNQQGALALIARAPLGRIAVAVAAVGLLAYALWKLGQAGFGRGPEGGGDPEPKDRVANAAGGVVYLAFFAVAVQILLGSSSSGSSGPSQAASGILGWPGGAVIVGVAGAVLIAISLYQIYDAGRGSFAEDAKISDMSDLQYRSFMVLGRVGLTARAIVFGLIGYFVVKTAIEFNPHEAVGLDGALGRVHHEPYGPWLLGLAAAGLIVFATYSLMEARYRRL
ncbi:MAG: DUF1206 domain-containing protein [Solirubrobacterales bacterium]|nr:DUF1206 domain-containing protein [Solirubrobacterales bacterium]